ncbi:hypothetical protein ACFQU2_19300 [Siccirubricoccus deserti]
MNCSYWLRLCCRQPSACATEALPSTSQSPNTRDAWPESRQVPKVPPSARRIFSASAVRAVGVMKSTAPPRVEVPKRRALPPG